MIVIVVFGILFQYAFNFFNNGFRVQTVLLWGLHSRLHCPHMFDYSAHREILIRFLSLEINSASQKKGIDGLSSHDSGRWLVMAGFCLFIFLIGLWF